jgi:hypothetical protein
MAAASILAHDQKRLLVGFEIFFIATVLAITLWGAARRWHQRWIDYRHLAELLRHIRLLLLTGSSSAEMHPARGETDNDPGASWVNWYYRATVREIGLIGFKADRSYVKDAIGIATTTELQEQISYHRRNKKAMERASHWLDFIGALSFFVTATICLFYLAGWLQDKFVTAFTAFLPALGAAMLGIRFQGDFASVASQSDAMESKLEALKSRLNGAKDNCDLALASKLLEDATEAMAAEVTEWRFVFRGKPLTLPS